MEMIEMDPCSLSYQRVVSDILKGSVAFFQKRCYPLTVMPTRMSGQSHSLPGHEKHLQESVFFGSLIPEGGRRSVQQLSLLSVTDVHKSVCFLVVVCPRGFPACKLLLYYSFFGSFCNSFGILKK